MRRITAALVLLLAAGTLAAALAQDFIGGRRAPMPEPGPNQPYDARLTFVRLRYTMGFGGRRGGEPPWAHDYPTADVHVMKILNELTLTRPRVDASNIMSLADPELHNYPICVHVGTRLLVDGRGRSEGAAELSGQGRVHDLR